MASAYIKVEMSTQRKHALTRQDWQDCFPTGLNRKERKILARKTRAGFARLGKCTGIDKPKNLIKKARGLYSNTVLKVCEMTSSTPSRACHTTLDSDTRRLASPFSLVPSRDYFKVHYSKDRKFLDSLQSKRRKN